MLPARSIVLVGRPNVGKSRLFNRLAGRRVAIVHDEPGITRDLVTATVPAARGGYTVVDSGGLGFAAPAASAAIVRAAETQLDAALAAAALVLFVVDARAGLLPGDEAIAARLRKARKPVLFVANKADRGEIPAAALGDFHRLGFGEPLAVSAEHGAGVGDLQEKILEISRPPPAATALAEEPPRAPAAPAPGAADAARTRVKFALVGRPNVGKSSLGNALLQTPRLIVSDVPGTTRDAIGIDFSAPGADGVAWDFTLHDTAGLRHGGRVKSSVEYFSQTRTREALAGCDVAVLVLDALDGVTKQDKTLAGEILAAGVALLVVVNKWDLARARFAAAPPPGVKGERQFRRDYEAAVQRELFFTPHPPVLFASAATGAGVREILPRVRALFATLRLPLPTGALNRVLRARLEETPPKLVAGRRFKCYYAVQVARQPFSVRLYCNAAAKLDEAYARFLETALVEHFRLHGCPVRFDLVSKPPRTGSAFYLPQDVKFSRAAPRRPRSQLAED